MAHHKRQQPSFVSLVNHPISLDFAQVSASTYSSLTSALTISGQTTTIYKWLPTFTQGGVSLEAGIFYQGEYVPNKGWNSVSNGLITVYSSGQEVTAPISTTTTVSASTSTTPDQNTSSVGMLSSQSSNAPQGSITATPPTPSATREAPSLPQEQSSGGVSSGVVAGAAIGCLVGGLLIGGIIAWLVLRKKGGRRAAPAYAPVRYDSSEKQAAIVTTAGVSSSHSGIGLEQFLLDSKPDSEIAAEARSLNLLIQQHVEDNYHLQKVQLDSNALAQTLAELEIGIPDSTGAFGPTHLASLALEPRTRHAALRHIISQAAFNASSIHQSGPISLLPHQVGSVVRGVPPVERHRGNAQAVDAALTRWRQLSAFLLNPSRSERTPLIPTEDVSTQQAQHLTTILNRFTGAFASSDREQAYEQENHLREVIVECAGLGYVLFSQPAEFRFNFIDKGSAPNRGKCLVTFPGLEKIRDESGMGHQSPITVTEPVVEK